MGHQRGRRLLHLLRCVELLPVPVGCLPRHWRHQPALQTPRAALRSLVQLKLPLLVRQALVGAARLLRWGLLRLHHPRWVTGLCTTQQQPIRHPPCTRQPRRLRPVPVGGDHHGLPVPVPVHYWQLARALPSMRATYGGRGWGMPLALAPTDTAMDTGTCLAPCPGGRAMSMRTRMFMLAHPLLLGPLCCPPVV